MKLQKQLIIKILKNLSLQSRPIQPMENIIGLDIVNVISRFLPKKQLSIEMFVQFVEKNLQKALNNVLKN